MDEVRDHNKSGLDKDKILEERNDKSKAFQKNWEDQKIRDQVVMPIDDLPLEDIEMEKKKNEINMKQKMILQANESNHMYLKA